MHKKMVDGDEYLINLVKERAALWNKEDDDYKNIDFKKFLWNEIADKIGSDKDFLRRRWTNLREKFVRVLRYNEVYADNFKHFNNMLFLKRHIHLRGVSTTSESEQSEAQQIIFVDDETDTMNPKIEILEPNSQDVSNDDSDDFEFTITEEHINHNSDTEEVIFVELNSDEETSYDNKRKMDNTISYEVPIKKSRSSETIVESTGDEKSLQADRTSFNDCYRSPAGNCLENRCEDQIFGELVTAMLLKMDAESKRKIKKEIMNVLLQ